MSLPHVLLGILRTPATGYDIRREFESGAAYFWAAELSQIYPALKKLETQGFVQSEDAASDQGPRRRLYHRTAAGKNELVRWVSSGPVVGTQRLAYVGQILYAFEADDLQVVADLVADLRSEFQPMHDLLASVAEEVAEPANDEELHDLIGLRLGVLTNAARLAWCDEAEEIIRQKMKERNP